MSLVSVLDDQPLAIGGSRNVVNTIGVLNFDPAPRARSVTVGAIERAVERQGCSLCIVRAADLKLGELSEAIERLRVLPIDGVLAIAPGHAEMEALAAILSDLPLVAVATEPHDDVTVVATDDYAAAAAATRHLLALGHSTVAHVAGPVGSHEADQRLAGWRDALSATGVEVPEPVLGDWSPECGYRLGLGLAARPEITAILVAGDRMALGVLRALREAGRRVPEDVSVIGLDGITEAEFFDPPLTTVRQDVVELGRRSVQLLRERIEPGGCAPRVETVPAQLILRASAGPPPRAEVQSKGE